MLDISPIVSRRTAADDVFARLQADILDLTLTPGAKLSEVDVARQFDVSRQPVREAFIRLAELELLQVRPQRATEVRRISVTSILNARFIRTAVEIEIIRRACSRDTSAFEKRFETNLAQQHKAIMSERHARFGTLDHEFHELLGRAADCDFATEMLAAKRYQADRACRLSLKDPQEMNELHDDHVAIYRHVKDGDTEPAVARIRQHLSRIEKVLKSVKKLHPEYFEPD